MKNRFVKITLTICMLLVMTVPTQVLAAEQCNTSTLQKVNYSNIYAQLSQDSVAKIQNALAKYTGGNYDFSQLQNAFKNYNVTVKSNPQTAPVKPTVQAPAPAKPAASAPATPAPAKPATPAPAKPATPAPATPAPAKPAAPAPAANIGAYEQQVVDLVNKERAAVGLPALKVNTKLAGVAEKKAEDLRDKNYFSHTSPTYGSPFDMMKQFGINYRSAGENIAKGQKTPEAVMNGWMNSQGHKDNILNSSYTEIGVGYVTDSNGTTYWVQMFIRP